METNSNLKGKEARSEARVILRCNATILFKDVAPMSARTMDISSRGICLLAPSDVSPGCLCGIRFTAPIQGKIVKIEAVAKAVYSICIGTGFRIGYEFAGIDAASLLAIKQLIQNNPLA